MYVQTARRLKPSDSGIFFVTVIKPKMPEPKGMSNKGVDTQLRKPITNKVADLISSNSRCLMVLSFSNA